MRRLYGRFFYYRDCSTEAEAGALYRLNKREQFNRAVGLGWQVDEVLYVIGVAKTPFYRRQRRREAEGFEGLLNKPRCAPIRQVRGGNGFCLGQLRLSLPRSAAGKLAWNFHKIQGVKKPI